jgi:hypothetical protein
MEEQKQPLLEFKRSPDFHAEYANNAQFELSAFDFKIVFGQLEQHEGKSVINQHTAITISPIEAKILSYFLGLNILFHEATHGKIRLAPNLLPPPPPTEVPPEFQGDERAKGVWESWAKLHAEFLASAK